VKVSKLPKSRSICSASPPVGFGVAGEERPLVGGEARGRGRRVLGEFATKLEE